jgi:hypothetical protein
MLFVFERQGETWVERLRAGPAEFRGVPVFVGGERYLIVASEEGDPTMAGERRPKAKPAVWDLGSWKEVDLHLDPVYAWHDNDQMGSAVDDQRFLLSRYVDDKNAEIVLYDLRMKQGRVLRTGREPVMVGEDKFVFFEQGAVWTASLSRPTERRHLVDYATIRTFVPGKCAALVSLFVRDPAYKMYSPTLWEVSADSGERRMVLDRHDYSWYGIHGCVSWYPADSHD